MKNSIYILFLILLWSCKSNNNLSNKDVHVLFIGNSLTYYNDMPQMLQEMLKETNENIKVEQSTFSGYSLDAHLDDIITFFDENTVHTRKKEAYEMTKTERKIKERNWDVIIMQTGTVSVLIPEARDISIQNAIRGIKRLSSNPKCKYVMFSTWASKLQYPEKYCYSCSSIDKALHKKRCCSPTIKNVEQHVELINNSYAKLSQELSLIKTNHTDKAYRFMRKYPDIVLLEDDIHPNKNGAFFNACVFYELLTKKPAKDLKYIGSIPANIANQLKKGV